MDESKKGSYLGDDLWRAVRAAIKNELWRIHERMDSFASFGNEIANLELRIAQLNDRMDSIERARKKND